MKQQKPIGLNESIKLILRDYTEALLVAIIVAVIVRVFFYSAYKIPTPFMEPTLKVGDFILVSKWEYGLRIPFLDKPLFFKRPSRGDVVVFRCADNRNQHCARRVIGLPGDRIQLVKKRLVVNQQFASYSLLKSFSEKDSPSAILQEKTRRSTHEIRIDANTHGGSFGPIIVPPGQLFLLSDYRDGGEDSRSWGSLPLNDVVGRARYIWMSMDWSSTWKGEGWPEIRWKRVFDPIK